MKKFLYVAMLAVLPLTAMAQHEEDTENGVVSLAGREGFTIETKKGDFVFKPYLLVQTSANFNWMMMKAWIRLITKIILPIRVFPFLMPYLALPARLLEKSLSICPSMLLQVEERCCSRRGSMYS